ncbi:MAG: gliding motility-associated C-terminal domain-containing protein, partial [Bacteroidia bacterium]|nr:gliding motility-associated C-terminal domain-containing protein [Bacteroidia bacterium]
GSVIGSSAIVSPTSTTTYTVDGDNGLGCIASETITINVNSAPSVSVVATPTALCASGSATLTASGAATYTWNPTSLTGASIVDTPTLTTTYTVIGEDAIGCNNTQTVTINVGISPANITASVSNNITCNTPTVSLTGNSTDVGVDYLWTGPGSYTSAIQNPTDIITAGDYTLNVTNPLSGCSTTTIISVSSNTIVPDITATSSGSLGCNNSVTITAVSTSTNTLNYTWFGPSSYTSSVQSPTTNIAGDYTISITDITNGCVNSSSTTVGTNTTVPSFTANVIAATCSGAIANNDGTILLSGFNTGDNYDLVQASTYTGSASYGSATPIPTTGIITNTLNNPSVTIPYTIRVFSANGCFSDTTINLTPASCLTATTSIGVAKSGSVSGVLADKTLDVTYVITVKNLGTDTINFVQVTDSLVIPSPATFSIKSGPTTTGSLTANSNYNGNSDIGLLVAGSSKLAPGQSETITFILNITPNGLNSITNIAIAAGFGELGNIVKDTSNMGNEPDPNGNNNATEFGENIPTVLQLPDVNLFIPEVFTPDGDGKNDFFVIKGIEGRTVKIIVFNRWGNKVYENESYNNTWGGMPNVSGLIIGNNKLPQGTYYYIVEFEDGVDKPINGYVVLQY